jgi:hypothetical protein
MPNNHVQLAVRCAGQNCGRVKGETNHWWIARLLHNQFVLDAWNEEILKSHDNALPLCSESCASRLLSQFMHCPDNKRTE